MLYVFAISGDLLGATTNIFPGSIFLAIFPPRPAPIILFVIRTLRAIRKQISSTAVVVVDQYYSTSSN